MLIIDEYLDRDIFLSIKTAIDAASKAVPPLSFRSVGSLDRSRRDNSQPLQGGGSQSFRFSPVLGRQAIVNDFTYLCISIAGRARPTLTIRSTSKKIRL